MKTIGLIGGMSWHSSLEYYRIINTTVQEMLGGQHSAKSVMYSFNFAEIESLQIQGKWETLTKKIIEAAKRLEDVGADFIVICTNTVHKVADEVQDSISIPLLHIADTTAERMRGKFKKIGLLGTKFTMEEDFYKGRLEKKYGFEVITPGEDDRRVVHDIIYNELVIGKIMQSSKEKYIKIIKTLIKRGAECIILGCTEIPLLIKQEDFDLPLLDTTAIHAKSAVEFALEN